MQTPWGFVETHHPPDQQHVPSLVIDCPRGVLAMSIGGHEIQPDDLGCGCDLWFGENDNEAPFAWRDRRPTY